MSSPLPVQAIFSTKHLTSCESFTWHARKNWPLLPTNLALLCHCFICGHEWCITLGGKDRIHISDSSESYVDHMERKKRNPRVFKRRKMLLVRTKELFDVIVNILEHRWDSNKYRDDWSLIVEVSTFNLIYILYLMYTPCMRDLFTSKTNTFQEDRFNKREKRLPAAAAARGHMVVSMFDPSICSPHIQTSPPITSRCCSGFVILVSGSFE